MFETSISFFNQLKNKKMVTVSKEVVLKHLSSLPEKVSIDEMIEKLLFIYEVEIGMEQSKKGQVTPFNEVKEKYKKWLK